jgi:hypothetical protein
MQQIFILTCQNPKKMDHQALPYSKLNLMHEIDNEKRVDIEADGRELV